MNLVTKVKTTEPIEKLDFNQISQNIHNQLIQCYDQSKKFLHEEKKYLANRRNHIVIPAAVLGR